MSATVVSVNEIAGSTGRTNPTETNFRREFIVKLSAADVAGSDLALYAAAIPSVYDAWPGVVSGRRTPWVQDKSVQLVSTDNHLLWRVTVEYSNKVDPRTPIPDDPWDADPIYSAGAVEYEVALEQDYAATPVQVRNAAGDQFDPLPSVPHTNRLISVQINTANFNEADIAAIINTVNSGSITIRGNSYASETLRMLRWQVMGSTYINGTGGEVAFYVNNIDIEVSTFSHGHKLKILNQGYRAKDDDGNITRIMDDSTPPRPVPQPALLADNGAELDDDGTPVFLEFNQFPSSSWSAITSLGI